MRGQKRQMGRKAQGRPRRRAVPLAGRTPGGRKRSRARKGSSASSPMAFARGLLSRVSANKSSKGAKRSRKAPALLAVLGGAGAAAAAAKRRRSGRQQPPDASAHGTQTSRVAPAR